MKRAALILLTFIYVLSCTGMAIDRFYCCGKLASVKLEYGAGDNATQTKTNNKGCCKHELQNLKVKDNHFNSVSFSISKPLPVILPSFADVVHANPVISLNISTCYQSNAPPELADKPIYTLNCAYRI